MAHADYIKEVKQTSVASHEAVAGEASRQNVLGASNEAFNAAKKAAGNDSGSSKLPVATTNSHFIEFSASTRKDGAAAAANDPVPGAAKDLASGAAKNGSNRLHKVEAGASNLAHKAENGAAHAVGDVAAVIAQKAENLGDIGKTLAVGGAEAAWNMAKGIGDGVKAGVMGVAHGFEKSAEWVGQHPYESATIAATVVAVGALEIGTAGLATPLVAGGLATAGSAIGSGVAAVGGIATVAEATGAVLTGYQLGKATADVIAHGDIGTLWNQEKHSATENDKARQGLKADTGEAVATVGTMLIGAGIAKAFGVAAEGAAGAAGAEKTVAGASGGVEKVVAGAAEAEKTVAGAAGVEKTVAAIAEPTQFKPQVFRAAPIEGKLGGRTHMLEPIFVSASQALDEGGRMAIGVTADIEKGTIHGSFGHRALDQLIESVHAPISEISGGFEVRVNGANVPLSLREIRGFAETNSFGSAMPGSNYLEWSAPGGGTKALSDIELSFNGKQIGHYSYDPMTKEMTMLESPRSLSAFDIRQFHERPGFRKEWAESGTTIDPFEKPANQVDLHTHFSGAMRTETLLEVAQQVKTPYPTALLDEFGIHYLKSAVKEVNGKPTVTLNPENFSTIGGYQKLEKMLSIPEDRKVDFKAMEQIYKLRSPLTKDLNAFPSYLEKLAQDYKSQGIRYAELSISDVVKPEWREAAAKVLPNIEKKTGVKMSFVVGMWRLEKSDWNEQLIEKLKTMGRDPHVVGVDFMGEELNSTKDFAKEMGLLAEIRKERPEFQVRVHAGENTNHLQNIKDAIKLGATRIGHGVYGVDEETLALAKAHDVIIEFNTNSNIALSNIEGTEQLPVKKYLDAGVRVSLGTDGHGIYHTSARSEEAVMKSLGLSKEDLAKITASDKRYTNMMEAAWQKAEQAKY